MSKYNERNIEDRIAPKDNEFVLTNLENGQTQNISLKLAEEPAEGNEGTAVNRQLMKPWEDINSAVLGSNRYNLRMLNSGRVVRVKNMGIYSEQHYYQMFDFVLPEEAFFEEGDGCGFVAMNDGMGKSLPNEWESNEQWAIMKWDGKAETWKEVITKRYAIDKPVKSNSNHEEGYLKPENAVNGDVQFTDEGEFNGKETIGYWMGDTTKTVNYLIVDLEDVCRINEFRVQGLVHYNWPNIITNFEILGSNNDIVFADGGDFTNKEWNKIAIVNNNSDIYKIVTLTNTVEYRYIMLKVNMIGDNCRVGEFEVLLKEKIESITE